MDANGRIIVTLRSRSGRLIGCYAVPAGRSAVVARDIIGRPSEPAVSQYPTTLPPAPEVPVDPGIAPLKRYQGHASSSAAILVWACGTVLMAILAVLALRDCEPLHPEPIPQPAYRVAP